MLYQQPLAVSGPRSFFAYLPIALLLSTLSPLCASVNEGEASSRSESNELFTDSPKQRNDDARQP